MTNLKMVNSTVGTMKDFLKIYEESLMNTKIFVTVELAHGIFEGELMKVDSENLIYYVNTCKFWFESNKFYVNSIVERETFKTLLNGVKVHELTVMEDHEESQRLLDLNHKTRNIDSEFAYNERVSNSFVGTYEITINRFDDYTRFVEKMKEEKKHIDREYWEKHEELERQYYADTILFSEYREKRDQLRAWMHEQKATCTCGLCETKIPTIEEWKEGKIVTIKTINNAHFQGEKRIETKLNKTLQKGGFSQQLIDLYSQQIKTEKTVFFTISDRPQHITGMSAYAKLYTWDGYNGSSCQDPRHTHANYPIRLGGSLHDNKLFVGMLHDSMEDLNDMTDKLIARTVLRLVHIDEKPCMISTAYYGNNETKNLLDNAIKQLRIVDIYDNSIIGTHDSTTIRERANGYFEMCEEEEIHVCETIEEDVSVTCPCCHNGTMEVYADRLDTYVNIECPACGGTGRYETTVEIDIDEWVTHEETIEVSPYFEEYSHEGNYVSMYVNLNTIRANREDNNL